jgi:hypothetical protein
MQRRPVEEYDRALGPAIYRNRAWPKPTGRVLAFSDTELDNLRLYYPFNARQALTFGGVQIVLDPERIHPFGNGQGYLEKADVVVLAAIKDQMGKRTVFFSRTVGGYADEFGLTPYLEGHGFARALRPHPLVASDSVQALPGFGWVNLPRSKALAFDVYHGNAAARPRPRGWVDRPSEGIRLYGIYAALPVAPGHGCAGAARRDGRLIKNTTSSARVAPGGAVSEHGSRSPRIRHHRHAVVHLERTGMQVAATWSRPWPSVSPVSLCS